MSADTAYVRCFASLHTLRREQGLPPSFEVPVPEEGLSAAALAEALNLSSEQIEGVFLNNRNFGMDAIVRRGDCVAFVPHGTPASYPSFFGPFVTRT